MKFMSLFRAFLTSITLFALASSPTLAEKKLKLVVDDDGVECGNAEFSSIQAAVDAAVPPTDIKICAGTYQELVTI